MTSITRQCVLLMDDMLTTLRHLPLLNARTQTISSVFSILKSKLGEFATAKLPKQLVLGLEARLFKLHSIVQRLKFDLDGSDGEQIRRIWFCIKESVNLDSVLASFHLDSGFLEGHNKSSRLRILLSEEQRKSDEEVDERQIIKAMRLLFSEHHDLPGEGEEQMALSQAVQECMRRNAVVMHVPKQFLAAIEEPLGNLVLNTLNTLEDITELSHWKPKHTAGTLFFDPGQHLAEGTYGEIVYTLFNRMAVATRPLPPIDNLSIRSRKELRTLLLMWNRELKHKNICEFYGVVLERKTWDLHLEGGHTSLDRLLHPKGDDTYYRMFQGAKKRDQIIRGIAKGLAFLHTKNVLFKCLNPEKVVLITKKPYVRLTGFGLHFLKNVPRTNEEGDIDDKYKVYLAPEVLASSDNYTSYSDVYSFGVIVWEYFKAPTYPQFGNVFKLSTKEGDSLLWLKHLTNQCLAEADMRPLSEDVDGVIEINLTNEKARQALEQNYSQEKMKRSSIARSLVKSIAVITKKKKPPKKQVDPPLLAALGFKEMLNKPDFEANELEETLQALLKSLKDSEKEVQSVTEDVEIDKKRLFNFLVTQMEDSDNANTSIPEYCLCLLRVLVRTLDDAELCYGVGAAPVIINVLKNGEKNKTIKIMSYILLGSMLMNRNNIQKEFLDKELPQIIIASMNIPMFGEDVHAIQYAHWLLSLMLQFPKDDEDLRLTISQSYLLSMDVLRKIYSNLKGNFNNPHYHAYGIAIFANALNINDIVFQFIEQEEGDLLNVLYDCLAHFDKSQLLHQVCITLLARLAKKEDALWPISDARLVRYVIRGLATFPRVSKIRYAGWLFFERIRPVAGPAIEQILLYMDDSPSNPNILVTCCMAMNFLMKVYVDMSVFKDWNVVGYLIDTVLPANIQSKQLVLECLLIFELYLKKFTHPFVKREVLVSLDPYSIGFRDGIPDVTQKVNLKEQPQARELLSNKGTLLLKKILLTYPDQTVILETWVSILFHLVNYSEHASSELLLAGNLMHRNAIITTGFGKLIMKIVHKSLKKATVIEPVLHIFRELAKIQQLGHSRATINCLLSSDWQDVLDAELINELRSTEAFDMKHLLTAKERMLGDRLYNLGIGQQNGGEIARQRAGFKRRDLVELGVPEALIVVGYTYKDKPRLINEVFNTALHLSYDERTRDFFVQKKLISLCIYYLVRYQHEDELQVSLLLLLARLICCDERIEEHIRYIAEYTEAKSIGPRLLFLADDDSPEGVYQPNCSTCKELANIEYVHKIVDLMTSKVNVPSIVNAASLALRACCFVNVRALHRVRTIYKSTEYEALSQQLKWVDTPNAKYVLNVESVGSATRRSGLKSFRSLRRSMRIRSRRTNFS